MENNFSESRDYVSEIVGIISTEISDEKLLDVLSQYHDNDIAGAFEQLTPADRKRLYRIIGEDRFSEIFAYVEDAKQYIDELGVRDAAKILGHMDSDDAVDILDDVDDEIEEKIVGLMDDDSSRDIRLIRSYEDDEIGSRMTTNFIGIKRGLSVKQAMKELIAQAGENDNISTIYVSEIDGRFYGAISLKDLIVARENTELETLISKSYPYVTDKEKVTDCLERIKDYTEDSFPVLNSDGRIIGIITSQDIVEVIDEEMGEDYAKFAGLTAEEDLKESVAQSIKKRIPWLMVLLALAIGVSAVVGMFETVVAQIAIIVCFQSLILDMAGNVGTQSLAVTIRVLTDENLKARQKAGLVLKEMRIGFFNGLLLGTISFIAVGAYIALAKGYDLPQAFAISGCVGISLLVSMLVSALVGTCVPMLFHKLKIDPAVASGPLITTVNDLVAVVAYYGLSWILLINILHIS